MLISKGVVDALDHSSNEFAVGGKLGIDCTGQEVEVKNFELLSDENLFKKVSDITDEVDQLKQYFINTKNPICVITVDKRRKMLGLFEDLKPLFKFIRILIIVDSKVNDIDNPYMLLWRVVNNMDSNRDIFIYKESVCIDGTNKGKIDDFPRRWPDDVLCTKSVLENLKKRGLTDIDNDFIKKWGLL
jgi:4-hydroxy-3-polyprenylbenzoate decarboxylase